jgi:hypothetical protein
MVKIDIQDAYLHVPIHPSERKYLGFRWANSYYQFVVLPFDVSSAPCLFTDLLSPILTKARELGIRVSAYLDDLCILADSEATALKHGRLMSDLLASHGWLVNSRNSTINSPSQRQEFLGTIVDTVGWTF